MKVFALILFSLLSAFHARSQFLMEMMDTTKDVGKGLLSIYHKFDRIRISGYMQPQYQVAESKGASTYAGGDFPPQVNNRFMLRRGRIRFEYAHFNEESQPVVQFVFQFDGTERGVFIRDFWGRIFENKWQVFAFSAGMFARPFGYELNLSSSDRESPERGRMSQMLMRTERDLGAMVSFEPRNRKNFLKFIKVDAGFFNGQGLTATKDFDSYKDFIARAGVKPFRIASKVFLSAAVSYFNGGMLQNNKFIFQTKQSPIRFQIDSSITNQGEKAPRKYYGADAQLRIRHGWGASELRAEYWSGTQTATESTSETPATLLTEPYYIRQFNGAFFYFLQNIINARHQLGIKYDWYDPNRNVSGSEINAVNNFTSADIRYATLGFGYIHHFNENLKMAVWYESVTNEKTGLAGYTNDLKDNIFTTRLQFRF